MTTIARSTYNKIINDVIGDISEQERREPIAPEQYQNWILRAHEELCKRLKIYEQYEFLIEEDVTDYPLQDRPLVTGATNATPIVITAASHGLANLDRINMREVEGTTTANGARQVSGVTTDTFELNEYADITNATNATPIQITTEQPHGWSTGAIIGISGVEGNEAANDQGITITVVDEYNFTLDGISGDGDYTSGGIALKTTVGNGTYLYGGQFWKTNELPTYVRNVAAVRRTWSNIYRPVRMVGEIDLIHDQIFESSWGLIRSSYSNPVEASFITINGQRYFHFFANPDEDEDATLVCQIEIIPDRYRRANLNAMIPLRSTYDDATKAYVKAMLYERLGLLDKSQYHMQMFDSKTGLQKTISIGSSRKRVTYT